MPFPTLFCSVFLMLTGLLFFMAGVILDVIAKRDRKDYTFQSNLIDYERRTRLFIQKERTHAGIRKNHVEQTDMSRKNS